MSPVVDEDNGHLDAETSPVGDSVLDIDRFPVKRHTILSDIILSACLSICVAIGHGDSMNESRWLRYAPYALLATAVFAFMHVADELAGNWDAGAAGQPMGDPTVAAISVGVFTLVGMGALWLILTDRPWGYVLAGLFGIMFLVTGASHFVNTADMTTFRWIVVVLEVAAAALLVVLSLAGVRVYRPWRSGRVAGSKPRAQ